MIWLILLYIPVIVVNYIMGVFTHGWRNGPWWYKIYWVIFAIPQIVLTGLFPTYAKWYDKLEEVIIRKYGD